MAQWIPCKFYPFIIIYIIPIPILHLISSFNFIIKFIFAVFFIADSPIHVLDFHDYDNSDLSDDEEEEDTTSRRCGSFDIFSGIDEGDDEGVTICRDDENDGCDQAKCRLNLTAIDYFSHYVPKSIVSRITSATNEILISLDAPFMSIKEFSCFLGIYFMITITRLPSLDMYWNQKLMVKIDSYMDKARFLLILNSLRVMKGKEVSDERKRGDNLWKLRPLINHVLTGCMDLSRPKKAGIVESRINFKHISSSAESIHLTDTCYIGSEFRMFKLVATDGTILDFEIFTNPEAFKNVVSAYTALPPRNLSIEEMAILRFQNCVNERTRVYFDSSFSTPLLFSDISKTKFRAIGELKRKYVYPLQRLNEVEFFCRRQNRPMHIQHTIYNGEYTITQSLNNRIPCYIASSSNVTEKVGDIDRFKKYRIRYQIPHCIGLSHETRKTWTIPCILNFFDIAATNARRNFCASGGRLKRKSDFIVALSQQLLNGKFWLEVPQELNQAE